MRLGIVARADDRGLGHLTWEATRALQPDRVLVVTLPPERASGFEQHVERYPGATVVEWQRDGTLDESVVRSWLDGLDVAYLAETPYDDRFAAWAADAGVRVVLHAMPEFFRPEWAAPNVELWNPTTWRHDSLPGAHVVGVPVALDRWPDPAPHRHGWATFVHVAGHRTAGDRNGTILLVRALRAVTRPMRVRVYAQGHFPGLRAPKHVEIEVVRNGDHAYWQMYDDADALVLPRRYGGLSLPVQEAAGAGLALVLSDVAPNSTWPSIRVPARRRSNVRAPGGDVRSFECDARRLAYTLDRLTLDVELRHAQQHAARAWAGSHSWNVQRDDFLARLCG